MTVILKWKLPLKTRRQHSHSADGSYSIWQAIKAQLACGCLIRFHLASPAAASKLTRHSLIQCVGRCVLQGLSMGSQRQSLAGSKLSGLNSLVCTLEIDGCNIRPGPHWKIMVPLINFASGSHHFVLAFPRLLIPTFLKQIIRGWRPHDTIHAGLDSLASCSQA